MDSIVTAMLKMSGGVKKTTSWYILFIVLLHSIAYLCTPETGWVRKRALTNIFILQQQKSITFLQSINKFSKVQNITRIYALSKRNVILRYKNSLAGFLWGFLKPLIYLLIFIVIFSKGFPDIKDYVLYATSGLILWFFFSNITAQSVGNIVGSSGLIKSLNIPPVFFPLSEMLSELFNLLLTLVVFFIVMNWFHITYSFKLFLIIPCVSLFAVFAFGLSLMLTSLNVFFRDIGIIWNTVQPAIFYLTPIAYPEKLIPEDYKAVIQYNPIYYFIKLGRTIICNPTLPSADLWYTCIGLTVGMYIIGQFVFYKLKNQFISAI